MTFYMSHRQDIERDAVNIYVTHKIARMILEKDKRYSSYVTKAESQLFYSGFQASTEEEEEKEEEKAVRQKERDTVTNIENLNDPEEFKKWVKEMEHWMEESFSDRKNNPGWIQGEI